MAEYSFSLDGTHWRDSERLMDWECGTCRLRFAGVDKSGAVAHMRADHGGGTLYPRINTVGIRTIDEYSHAFNIKLNELSEPVLLDMMGFKGEMIVVESDANPISVSVAPKTYSGGGTPPKTTAQRKAAVLAWDAMPESDRPPLADWLCTQFGVGADNSPNVAESTFHGWRQRYLRPNS